MVALFVILHLFLEFSLVVLLACGSLWIWCLSRIGFVLLHYVLVLNEGVVVFPDYICNDML
uniref:Uncharacterized protein n=1 Tax=Rhizophora mucronata TaxID=61149 RepID=A0A2P2MGF0_RHIMU